MLVLSRRNSETIVFPTLGITVEVLSLRNSAVKLGVRAPADVPVLRGELEPNTPTAPVSAAATGRLLVVRDLLEQFKQKRQAGQAAEAEEALSRALAALEPASEPPIVPPAALPRAQRRPPVVPDLLAERNRLKGILRKEK
jgi:carbon storage regulator CsrA